MAESGSSQMDAHVSCTGKFALLSLRNEVHYLPLRVSNNSGLWKVQLNLQFN